MIKHIEKWSIFELEFNYECQGNPFKDVLLKVEFKKGDNIFLVDGFFDGDDCYKIRFMPNEVGEWVYSIKSNVKQLNDIEGFFECIEVTNNNFGKVEVHDKFHFKYAEGEIFYPIGTTAYAWIHQGEELEK